MHRNISIGLNRTGMKASPMIAGELMESLNLQEEVPAPAIGANDIRSDYNEQAEPVGSVPPPTSIKGVFGAAAEAVLGNRLHVLLDKLGERAGFERAGVRLYDALLLKISDIEQLPKGMSARLVREHRGDEAQHYQLLVDAIEELGGDPTTQTPCADVAATQGMGIVQVMSDPRTTLSQALQALLSAELIDQASWDLLIELVEGFDRKDLEESFAAALDTENRHAARVRAWLSAALSESALGE